MSLLRETGPEHRPAPHGGQLPRGPTDAQGVLGVGVPARPLPTAGQSENPHLLLSPQPLLPAVLLPRQVPSSECPGRGHL